MEKLKFVQTFNVAKFKQNQGVSEIEVKRNEKTGKNFFVFGFETGAVSEKFAQGKLDKPVISQVVSPETGDMFYLLHNQGEIGGATTVATL
jgi:hypothetical protein